MIGEAGRLEIPSGGFRSAKIFEWRSGVGMGKVSTFIPYETSEDKEKIDSLNKGDFIELTSKDHGWTALYKVQCFGVEHVH